MDQGTRRWLRRCLPLAGIALLAWLIFRVGPAALGRAFGTADPTWTVAALVFGLLPLGIVTLRWWTILAGMGIRCRFRDALSATVRGMVFAELTPAKLGDLMRVRYLERPPGVSAVRVAMSILVDRVHDVIALGALGSACLVLFSESLVPPGSRGRLLWLLLASLGACVGLLASGRVRGALLGPLGRLLGLRGVGRVGTGVREGLRALRSLGLGVHAVCFLLSVLGWLGRLGALGLLARGLTIPAPFGVVFQAGVLAILAGLLPVSFSGLGLREGAMVYFLGRAGVPAELGLALSLWYFALGIASVALPAALLLFVGGRRTVDLPGPASPTA